MLGDTELFCWATDHLALDVARYLACDRGENLCVRASATSEELDVLLKGGSWVTIEVRVTSMGRNRGYYANEPGFQRLRYLDRATGEPRGCMATDARRYVIAIADGPVCHVPEFDVRKLRKLLLKSPTYSDRSHDHKVVEEAALIKAADRVTDLESPASGLIYNTRTPMTPRGNALREINFVL